ncbi:MAG TPA: hypothetical protein VH186_15790 [Chloroflexia bacterium]|nr:hypothetical protein [Chloroflexia bacterium]
MSCNHRRKHFFNQLAGSETSVISALGNGSARLAEQTLEAVYQRAGSSGRAGGASEAQLQQAERDTTTLFLEFRRRGIDVPSHAAPKPGQLVALPDQDTMLKYAELYRTLKAAREGKALPPLAAALVNRHTSPNGSSGSDSSAPASDSSSDSSGSGESPAQHCPVCGQFYNPQVGCSHTPPAASASTGEALGVATASLTPVLATATVDPAEVVIDMGKYRGTGTKMGELLNSKKGLSYLEWLANTKGQRPWTNDVVSQGTNYSELARELLNRHSNGFTPTTNSSSSSPTPAAPGLTPVSAPTAGSAPPVVAPAATPAPVAGAKGYGKDGFNKEGFNRQGYDRDGFDKMGYDREGYSRQGYNRNGFNRAGYSRYGFNKDGYTPQGYNKDGYDRNGFNNYGFDASGYDKDGYDSTGFNRQKLDRNGYNEQGYHAVTGLSYKGYNRSGRDADGYDEDGYDKQGYDRAGYDKQGRNRKGELHPFFTPDPATGLYMDGCDAQGYGKDGYHIITGQDRNGYGRDGYNQHGWDRDGFPRSAFNQAGYDREGYDKEGFDKDGYDRLGYDQLGFDRNGYTVTGYDKDGFDKNGINRFGRDKNNKDVKTGKTYKTSPITRSGYAKDGLDKWGFNRDGLTKDGRNYAGWKFDPQNQVCYDPADPTRERKYPYNVNSRTSDPYIVTAVSSGSYYRTNIRFGGGRPHTLGEKHLEKLNTPRIDPHTVMDDATWRKLPPFNNNVDLYNRERNKIASDVAATNLAERWRKSEARVNSDPKATISGIRMRCPHCGQFVGAAMNHACPAYYKAWQQAGMQPDKRAYPVSGGYPPVIVFASGLAYVFGRDSKNYYKPGDLLDPDRPYSKPQLGPQAEAREKLAPDALPRSFHDWQYGHSNAGYDGIGYDQNGYNINGFDHSGYDRDGYDKEGFNKFGWDREGYDREGFNRRGIDRDGNKKPPKPPRLDDLTASFDGKLVKGDPINNEGVKRMLSGYCSAMTGKPRKIVFQEGQGFATDMQGTIYLDPYPLGKHRSMGDNLAVVVAGLKHELGHELYTNPDHWRRILEIARSADPVEGLDAGRAIVTQIYNTIEDGRMERAVAANHLGAAEQLQLGCSLQPRWDEQVGPRVPIEHQVLGAMLYTSLPFFRVTDEVRSKMTPEARAVFEEVEPLVRKGVLGSQADALEATLEITRILQSKGVAMPDQSVDARPPSDPDTLEHNGEGAGRQQSGQSSGSSSSSKSSGSKSASQESSGRKPGAQPGNQNARKNGEDSESEGSGDQGGSSGGDSGSEDAGDADEGAGSQGESGSSGQGSSGRKPGAQPGNQNARKYDENSDDAGSGSGSGSGDTSESDSGDSQSQSGGSGSGQESSSSGRKPGGQPGNQNARKNGGDSDEAGEQGGGSGSDNSDSDSGEEQGDKDSSGGSGSESDSQSDDSSNSGGGGGNGGSEKGEKSNSRGGGGGGGKGKSADEDADEDGSQGGSGSGSGGSEDEDEDDAADSGSGSGSGGSEDEDEDDWDEEEENEDGSEGGSGSGSSSQGGSKSNSNSNSKKSDSSGSKSDDNFNSDSDSSNEQSGGSSGSGNSSGADSSSDSSDLDSDSDSDSEANSSSASSSDGGGSSSSSGNPGGDAQKSEYDTPVPAVMRDIDAPFASPDALARAREELEGAAAFATQQDIKRQASPTSVGAKLHTPLGKKTDAESQTFLDKDGTPVSVPVRFPRRGETQLRFQDRRSEHKRQGRVLATYLASIRDDVEQQLNMQSRGKLDRGRFVAAIKGNKDVYSQKVELPATSFAVSISLDQSGSMNQATSSGALYDATMTLADALDQLEMPYEVRGFSARRDDNFQYKAFDDPLFDQQRAEMLTLSYGATYMADCVGLATTALAARPEANKLQIHMTDGALGDHVQAAEAIRTARERGCAVFGLFLGDASGNSERLDELYGRGNWMAINSLKDMPRQVGRRIATILQRLH